MLSSREQRDLRWFTLAVVAVVAGFSWGALPGLLCTAVVLVGGLAYRRRWRHPVTVTAHDRVNADALWQDAELALSLLERWQPDAVPPAAIDRLARAGRRALEAGRADPFSPHSGHIRHMLGMIGDCLAADASAGASGADLARRWATLFEEATLTLEHLSRAASDQENGMSVRLNVLEQEIRSLNNRDNV